MLEGKLVRLRPFRRDDINDFLRWFNDQEVIQYLTLYLPLSEKEEELYLDALATTRVGTAAMFVIESITGDKPVPIGSLELENFGGKDQRADFGIAIGEKEYWSQGYGTEATELMVKYGFEQLNLHRISSFAYSFNERSIRMHKKVGFVEEGRQLEACFRNGKWHDHVIFGLLRSEWEANHA